jgi:hypothetical protein
VERPARPSWAWKQPRAKAVAVTGTLLAAFVLLAMKGLGDPEPNQAAACVADRTQVPTLRSPEPGQTVVANRPHRLVVLPLDGATAYRWTIIQHGRIIAEAEELWDRRAHFWREVGWAYLHAQAGPGGADPLVRAPGNAAAVDRGGHHVHPGGGNAGACAYPTGLAHRASCGATMRGVDHLRDHQGPSDPSDLPPHEPLRLVAAAHR